MSVRYQGTGFYDILLPHGYFLSFIDRLILSLFGHLFSELDGLPFARSQLAWLYQLSLFYVSIDKPNVLV